MVKKDRSIILNKTYLLRILPVEFEAINVVENYKGKAMNQLWNKKVSTQTSPLSSPYIAKLKNNPYPVQRWPYDLCN
ncbi:hypothetical protein [aff. Roholtiella sp. LEGE 12411]|uniref:hypothetical protein n=1 Tax=aff. Roholtiella sp. LEGE 12411 TaxID=1828822 RepID=UPI00187F5ACB|nr:hypothetical protein [aff. Roholtiella sp. LEGE 12411]MBE9033931.1 hypothetical protein [aff. Roholtiella sp. LEGE 12411]